MGITGSYRWDKKLGKVVKVSDRIPIIHKIADWKRSGMNSGDEIRRGYAALENQGKLNEVHDPEVQADAT